MVDVATVFIAAISASAGLAGSIIAGQFNLKALVVAHRRDDAASLRDKVEELYVELDRIQDWSNVTAARAMAAINAKGTQEERFGSINLGKVRSIVGLYILACQPALDAFDERAATNGKTLRTDLEEKKLDPLTAGYGYVLLECLSVSTMCRETRGLLGKQAGSVGKSVRDGLGILPAL